MWQWLLNKLAIWAKPEVKVLPVWQPEWSDFLLSHVAFYQRLDEPQRHEFEHRCQLFLATTAVEGGVDVEVTDEDRLLVAASAVIPVWGFPGWHYFNVRAVFLLPAAFNPEFQCGAPDSRITGMVGTGPMAGKVALSKPDLHAGFANQKDKHNVGIHEFVHLVDMADGALDGFPERLENYRTSDAWFSLVQQKIGEMEQNKTGIPEYGATNQAEFFAVASEYFFERPQLLKKKHPQLYGYLSDFYQQNLADLRRDAAPHKNSPCPCGSGKKYKRCCMPAGR